MNQPNLYSYSIITGVWNDLDYDILLLVKEYLRIHLNMRLLNKDYNIFLEETKGENLFFVVEGSVKVTRLSKDGREVILAMLNAGDFFGEMSLLDGESRSANVIESLNRE